MTKLSSVSRLRRDRDSRVLSSVAMVDADTERDPALDIAATLEGRVPAVKTLSASSVWCWSPIHSLVVVYVPLVPLVPVDPEAPETRLLAEWPLEDDHQLARNASGGWTTSVLLRMGGPGRGRPLSAAVMEVSGDEAISCVCALGESRGDES